MKNNNKSKSRRKHPLIQRIRRLFSCCFTKQRPEEIVESAKRNAFYRKSDRYVHNNIQVCIKKSPDQKPDEITGDTIEPVGNNTPYRSGGGPQQFASRTPAKMRAAGRKAARATITRYA